MMSWSISENGDAGKLKIAMLGHKRVPSREGGVEIVVKELSCRMATLGHRVVCYNRGGHHVSGKAFDSATRLSTYKGVVLKSVFTIDRKGLAAMTSSVAAAFCAAFGAYDVVHFHAEGPCAMLWLPHLLGKRTIATIHGLDHLRRKWGRFAQMYIMLGERVATRYADEIIVLSEGVQRYFEDTYGRRTEFIPNGVAAPKRREAREIVEAYGLRERGYVLYLGRIVPEKGVHYLIEAFRRVNTDKKLVIAGGASDTVEYLQELTRMATGDKRILFTGFVQGSLLDELYSNAYLYTLPSDLEGMPLSLLEAMSYGNCCLVSDIPECTDVVENRAALFHRGDAKDLEDKLQALCEDEGMVAAYRDGVAEFVLEKYSWDEAVRKTIGLYRGRGDGVQVRGKPVTGPGIPAS